MKSLALGSAFFLVATSIAAQAGINWAQEPTDFKGVPFGANEKAVKEALRIRYCTSRGPDRECHADAKIGEAKVMIWFSLTNDAMHTADVLFDRLDYPRMKAAFIEKYGPPTEIHEEDFITKGAGTFPNEVLRWSGTRIEIELLEYSGSLRGGKASINTIEWLGELEKRRGEAAKKAAKDF